MTKSAYASHGWRLVRSYVLARDGHRCQIRLDGCTQHATQVDHIVKVEDGGAILDPHNLRAACKHCNVVRENEQRKTRHTNTDHAGPSRQW